MTACLLGVGSNVGDRQRWLELARQRLMADRTLRLIATSRWRESVAIGGPAHSGAYLNGVFCVETERSARDLLRGMLELERELGRQREGRWTPRTIDLDLLLYGHEVMDEPGLTVPHPWMALRRFVAEPAAEVAPHWQHPLLGWTLSEIWQHLRQVRPCVAVVGCRRREERRTVRHVAATCGADWLPRSASGGSLLRRSLPVRGRTVEFSGQASNDIEQQRTPLPRQKPVIAELGGEPGDWLCGETCRRPLAASSGGPVWDLVVLLSECPVVTMLHDRSPEPRAAAPKMPCPWLWIPRGDLPRLQHDLQAAMECLRPDA